MLKHGLAAAAMVGLVASACGTEVTVFGGTGGSVGDGGDQPVPPPGGGNVGGNVGGNEPRGCSDDGDCEVDAPCIEGVCDGGICEQVNLVEGAPCDDGGTAFCDGRGNCVGAQGAPCVDDADCQNDICVDGYCCDATCEQLCEACNVAGSEGVCSPQLPGTDPDDECADSVVAGVCDGAFECVDGAHLWSGSFGGTESQYGRDVAIDSAGNIVVIGYFFNTIDLGGGAFTSLGNRDIFVAKFDPAGNHSWSKAFGGDSGDYGWEVEVDGNDDIIVAGYFRGSLGFDTITPTSLVSQGGDDVFLAKLDSSGNHIWSKSFGDADVDQLWSLDVTSAGDIVIGGFFGGAIDFGGGALNSAGSNDGFVARFDSGGVHQWSAAYGDIDDQRVYGTAFDSGGNVIVAGRHIGSIDFGLGSLVSAGNRDIHVAKLDSTGVAVWAQQYGDDASQLAWDVAVDGNDNIVVAGYNLGTVNFGGSDISAVEQDIVVALLNANGVHQWSVGMGGPGNQEPNAVAFDSAGRVVLTGNAEGDVDFGGGQVSSAGQEDAFVVKLTEDGEHLWSHLFGSPQVEFGFGITADAMDNVIAVGFHAGTVDFGGGAVASAGSFDAFVVKLEP